MLTQIFARSWSSPSGSILDNRITVQAGAEQNISESIPAGANNLVAFSLDVSQLKGLYIVSPVALVLKTNSSGSPGNTITLTPGQAFMWMTGDAALRDTAGAAISTDITALYVTNPDTDA